MPQAQMNYLGRVGSDTGIRTRVSAVRGRRPGPLDDIANGERAIGTIRYFPMSGGLSQAEAALTISRSERAIHRTKTVRRRRVPRSADSTGNDGGLWRSKRKLRRFVKRDGLRCYWLAVGKLRQVGRQAEGVPCNRYGLATMTWTLVRVRRYRAFSSSAWLALLWGA